MQVTLTRVFISDKDKQGNPIINKFNNRPQHKIVVKTKEHGEEWLSAFISDPTDPRHGWKEGDSVEIVVEKKGQYLNFKLPDDTSRLKERVQLIEDRLKVLEMFMTKPGSMPVNAVKSDEEILLEDIPF